jgi:dTDP-4-dehydrorhamnose 3,5-epimerase
VRSIDPQVKPAFLPKTLVTIVDIALLKNLYFDLSGLSNEVFMKVKPGEISDVKMITPRVFCDERGCFMETYNRRKFCELGISAEFVQDNHSKSRLGTLRGLHYQIRQEQGKLVRVVAGEIYDVYVDLRRRSPTFGRWWGGSLSAENLIQLWLPPGFAHGFYVLSEWAEVLYKVTNFYSPEWERTLLWNDPEVGIKWPLPEGRTPFLSNKDLKGKLLREAEVYE